MLLLGLRWLWCWCSTVAAGSLCCHRLHPAAAQGFVKFNLVDTLHQANLYQGLLAAKQGALRIKQTQMAVYPIAVAQVSQVVTLAFGTGLCLLCGYLVAQGGTASQCVCHFAKGRLNGFFVLRQGNVTPGVAGIQVGYIAPPVKYGQVDLRQKRPGAYRNAVKQVVKFAAGAAKHASKCNTREKSRPRRANIGVGCNQLLLGTQDGVQTLTR